MTKAQLRKIIKEEFNKLNEDASYISFKDLVLKYSGTSVRGKYKSCSLDSKGNLIFYFTSHEQLMKGDDYLHDIGVPDSKIKYVISADNTRDALAVLKYK